MNILLVHTKDRSSNALAFQLEQELGAQLEWAGTYPEALDFFLEEKSFDLIVVENSTETLKILMYLLSVKLHLPYILIGEGDGVEAFPDLDCLGTLPGLDPQSLKKLVRQALEQGVVQEASVESDYCRIPTALLLEVVPLKADIYIRLSDIKFVKMFRQGAVFKPDDARRYVEKKRVTHLYVRKEEIQGFVRHFRDAVDQLVKESDGAPPEQAAQTAAQIFESVHQLSERVGFEGEVQDIAKQGVKMTMKSIGDSPTLSKMFDLIKKNPETYFSFHSIALAHISCSIAAKMEWPSGTTFNKLALASFFHDIAIVKPVLAEIETLEELEQNRGSLSEQDIERVKGHPQAASNIIRKLSEVPPDVDVILAQHHERSDGTGFPRGLTCHHIAPLAAVFIVSHDLVKFIYEKPEDPSLENFVRRFRYTQDYTKGTFAKAIQAIDFPLEWD